MTSVGVSDDTLLGALRGTPALRPVVDLGLAGGLRAWLDDGIFERIGVPQSAPVSITTRAIAGAPAVSSATALLRGALVAQLVRLRVAGAPVADAFDDAACALDASGRDVDLVAILEGLDQDEHARLAAEVAAHHAVLEAHLPSLPARWAPRCGVRQAVPVAGGDVVLRGVVDVALGHTGGERAGVCLVEVTTSRLEARHDRVLAYLSLLETLRTGEAPLRVAALSTQDGGRVVHDVTPALLEQAVGDVLLAIAVEAAA